MGPPLRHINIFLRQNLEVEGLPHVKEDTTFTEEELRNILHRLALEHEQQFLNANKIWPQDQKDDFKTRVQDIVDGYQAYVLGTLKDPIPPSQIALEKTIQRGKESTMSPWQIAIEKEKRKLYKNNEKPTTYSFRDKESVAKIDAAHAKKWLEFKKEVLLWHKAVHAHPIHP